MGKGKEGGKLRGPWKAEGFLEGNPIPCPSARVARVHLVEAESLIRRNKNARSPTTILSTEGHDSVKLRTCLPVAVDCEDLFPALQPG